MITKLDTENFFDAIDSADPILVDFWATWCGPCMMQGEILEQIAQAHPEYRIGKVIVFKNGQAVEQLVGLRQPSDIRAVLMKHED